MIWEGQSVDNVVWEGQSVDNVFFNGNLVYGPPLLTFTYSDNAGTQTGGTYTWTNTPIGSPASNRTIIILIAHSSAFALLNETSNVSVGGISATRVAVTNRIGPSFFGAVGIIVSLSTWVATVPTGTTATISFDDEGSASNREIVIYSAIGLDSNTPSDIDNGEFNAATQAVSLTVSQGGFIVGHNMSSYASGTSITNFTSDYNTLSIFDNSPYEASSKGNNLGAGTENATITISDANAASKGTAYQYMSFR
jgi:hypothetical protein